MAEKRSDVATARQEDQGRQTQSRQDEQHQQSHSRQENRQENRLARQTPSRLMNPFALLGRLAEEMTGVFDEVGFGARSRASQQLQRSRQAAAAWAPDIDVFQRANELVIRADLPGINPDDVNVEVSEDAVTISGERQQQQEEERGGVYRFERTYGAFFRVIPVPDGAIVDQAKATFKDGVLEITVPAPPEQVSRGRRLEISREESKDRGRQSS